MALPTITDRPVQDVRHLTGIAAPASRARTPSRAIAMPAAFGVALIGVFIVGFGWWAVRAPLMSASMASGSVTVESHRKTVQHLEGGIVAQILVRDGDAVALGQPLIKLDDVRARTTLSALQGQLDEALAAEARLIAERDARPGPEFPAALLTRAGEPRVEALMEGQKQLLRARRALVASKLDEIAAGSIRCRRRSPGMPPLRDLRASNWR